MNCRNNPLAKAFVDFLISFYNIRTFFTFKKIISNFIQSGFFMRVITAESSVMLISHSNSSPELKSNNLTIGAGMTVIILPAFFLIFVLKTIFISPYLLFLYIIISSLQYINLTINLYRNLYITLYSITT